MSKLLVTLTLLLSLFSNILSAQTTECVIYFQRNTYKIDVLLGNNAYQMEKLYYLLKEIDADPTQHLTMVDIVGHASPEGAVVQNESIVNLRLESVARNIQSRFNIPDRLINIVNAGVNWDDLYKLVKASNMEYKGEVISIIENTTTNVWWGKNEVNSRNKQLMKLRNGEPYNHMLHLYFPKLRTVTITLHCKKNPPPVPPALVEQVRDSVTMVNIHPVATPESDRLKAKKAKKAKKALEKQLKKQQKIDEKAYKERQKQKKK